MTEFTDGKGVNWNFNLTLGSAERVFEKTGVNLLAPNQTDENGVLYLTRLLYDDLLFGRVCLALLINQAAPPVEMFDAVSLKAMDAAFWTEYRRFFLERGKDWAAKAAEASLKEREANAAAAEELLTSPRLSSLPDEQD